MICRYFIFFKSCNFKPLYFTGFLIAYFRFTDLKYVSLVFGCLANLKRFKGHLFEIVGISKPCYISRASLCFFKFSISIKICFRLSGEADKNSLASLECFTAIFISCLLIYSSCMSMNILFLLYIMSPPKGLNH